MADSYNTRFSLQVGSPRAAPGNASSGAATAAQMAAAAALAAASAAGEAPGVVGAAAGPADVQVSKAALLSGYLPLVLHLQRCLTGSSRVRQRVMAGNQPIPGRCFFTPLLVCVRSVHAGISELHTLLHCCCSRLCRPLSGCPHLGSFMLLKWWALGQMESVIRETVLPSNGSSAPVCRHRCL